MNNTLTDRQTGELTGYPSIDKPWLKYFSDEAINEPLPNCTLYEYLYDNNKDNLNGVAINYYGNRITYNELFKQIDTISYSFLEYGVKPGDVVTLVTLSCIPSVLCLYSLNRIGAVSNYLNVLASPKELEENIKEAGSKIVISLDLFADKTLRAAKAAKAKSVIVYTLGTGMPLPAQVGLKYNMRKLDKSFYRDPIVLLWNDFISCKNKDCLDIKKDPIKPCYLAHTGGTTGIPKSVLLNDISFNSVVQHYIRTVPHKKGEVYLSMLIPYVVYGTLINIHMPLCLGLETVIVPKFEPEKWTYYFRKYKVNHCCSIPAYFAPMVNNVALQKMDLSYFKTAGMGGEGMNVPLEMKLNQFFKEHNSSARVLMGYGMTEVCATAVAAFHSARKIGSVGIPLPHNDIMIYNNEADEECKYGEEGEICLRCASEMIGYVCNDLESEKLFRVHQDGKKWLHTGDLGYIDTDGFVFIQGRLKRMIMTVINGAVYKVAPRTVEEVIDKHPGVLESCVVRYKKGGNYLLKAYVVCQEGQNVSEKELIEHCAKRLSNNAQPYKYEIIDELPRTSAGKVNYRLLENQE